MDPQSSRPTTSDSQLHDSPQNDQGSSRIKDKQVEIHRHDRWSKHVYPDVHKEIGEAHMLQKLCPTYEEIKVLAPEVPEMKKTELNSNKSTYCDYLNELSILVGKDGISHARYICGFSSLHLQLLMSSSSYPKTRKPRSITQLEPSVARILSL